MATTTRNRNGSDAITLLRKDHDGVKDLFRQFAGTGEDGQQRLAELICRLLEVHARIEEEIFYPAAREVLDDADLVEEAEVEHSSARALIQQIEAMDPSDEKYQATVSVLCEYVNHHVQEEQNELFPRVRKNGMDLRAVGEQLASRRTELMSEMGLSEVEAGEAYEEGGAASAGSRRGSTQRKQTSHRRGGNGRRAKASASNRGSSKRKAGKASAARSSSASRSRTGGARGNRRSAATSSR